MSVSVNIWPSYGEVTYEYLSPLHIFSLLFKLFATIIVVNRDFQKLSGPLCISVWRRRIRKRRKRWPSCTSGFAVSVGVRKCPTLLCVVCGRGIVQRGNVRENIWEGNIQGGKMQIRIRDCFESGCKSYKYYTSLLLATRHLPFAHLPFVVRVFNAIGPVLELACFTRNCIRRYLFKRLQRGIEPVKLAINIW